MELIAYRRRSAVDAEADANVETPFLTAAASSSTPSGALLVTSF